MARDGMTLSPPPQHTCDPDGWVFAGAPALYLDVLRRLGLSDFADVGGLTAIPCIHYRTNTAEGA